MLKKITIAKCRFMPDIGFFFGTTTEGESIVGEAIVEPSGTVNVEGEYKNHPKYGHQFFVSHIYYRDLKSLIAVLLSSGFLLGIRERKAVDMAKVMGERCFEILDACLENPTTLVAWKGMQKLPVDILQSVNGVGPIVSDQIISSWGERRGMAAASMLAVRVDMKPGQFRKALKYFGSSFQHVVMKDAYALTNVSGITWEVADRIALLEWEGKKAVDRNSIERLGAGVREVLRNKNVMGHMAYPVIDTLKEAVALLSPIEVKIWNTIFPHLEKLGLVYFEDKRMVAFKNNYDMEKESALKLKQLMKAPRAFPTAVDDREGMTLAKFRLGDEHIAAIRMALENNVSIVTGGPGTGKTTSVLNTLLGILDMHKVSYVMCAPTGKAAIRMTEASGRPAYTLHKHFVLYEDAVVSLESKYLIIDEMSMTDADVFNRVLRCVKPGQAVVFIGDGDQLPPVGAGEPFKQMLLANVPCTRLEKIYRQGVGSGIVNAAHMINHGEVPATMDNFSVETSSDIGVRDMIEGHINKLMLRDKIKFEDIQVLTPVNKGILGRKELNNYLQNIYNPRPDGWKGDYMVDDSVIHCKNNYRLGVMNGEVGVVTAVNNEKSSTDDVWTEGNSWKVQVRYAIHGTVTYFDEDMSQLQLAYAMTIHKTQGSEFRAVIAIFPYTSPFFYLRPLPYTGITRAKDQCIVLSVRNAFDQYVKGKTEAKRYSMLKDLLEENDNG